MRGSNHILRSYTDLGLVFNTHRCPLNESGVVTEFLSPLSPFYHGLGRGHSDVSLDLAAGLPVSQSPSIQLSDEHSSVCVGPQRAPFYLKPSTAPYDPANTVPTPPPMALSLLMLPSHLLPLPARVTSHLPVPGTVLVLALKVSRPRKGLSTGAVRHPSCPVPWALAAPAAWRCPSC